MAQESKPDRQIHPLLMKHHVCRLLQVCKTVQSSLKCTECYLFSVVSTDGFIILVLYTYMLTVRLNRGRLLCIYSY